MEDKESGTDKHETDDSDSDFDPIEHEKKRELLLRKAILAEKHYHEVRSLLREKRFAEVAKKKQQLKDGTCPDYLKRKNEIMQKAHQSHMENRALYELQKESALNVYEAQMEYIPHEQDDNRARLKQHLIDSLNEIIEEKKREERDFTLMIANMMALPPHRKSRPKDYTKLAKKYANERKKVIILETPESLGTTIFTHGAHDPIIPASPEPDYDEDYDDNQPSTSTAVK